MNPPSKDLVTEITKDRIKFLFKLMKEHPLHEIPEIFREKYKIDIYLSELEVLYPYWRKWKTLSFWSILKRIESEPPEKIQRDWAEIYRRITGKTNEDVVEFIYHHWKKSGRS